jgi:hypothetical protein
MTSIEKQALSVSSTAPVGVVSKCSSKAKRLVFTLKEESDDVGDSSSSDGSELEMNIDEEEIPVYDEDPITGKCVKSTKLSYKMNHVEDRVGAKINLKD